MLLHSRQRQIKFFSDTAHTKIFALGFNITALIWTNAGLGLEITTVPRPQKDVLRESAIFLFVIELLYASSLAFVKYSILAFYWRMFKTSNIKIPIIVLFVMSVIWLIIRVSLRVLVIHFGNSH